MTDNRDLTFIVPSLKYGKHAIDTLNEMLSENLFHAKRELAFVEHCLTYTEEYQVSSTGMATQAANLRRNVKAIELELAIYDALGKLFERYGESL